MEVEPDYAGDYAYYYNHKLTTLRYKDNFYFIKTIKQGGFSNPRKEFF
ncbi:MAG: hypothetical protein GX287_04635 [Fusobacteria bacterium]|nr:hypothetical protein [Fusobacteriota bacterium]